MTERAPRDRCRLPAPSWCRAGELSPVLSTRMCRLARQSWQSGASRPRPSCHARTPHRLRAPTNGSSHGPLLHRQATMSRRSRPRRNHHRRPKRNHQHTRRRPRRLTTTTKRPRLGVLHALICLLASCSALLRVPAGSFEKRGVPQFQRLAPPCLSLRPTSSSCGKLRERGRSSVPTPHSHEPTNGKRSPLCGAREKHAGKSTCLSEFLLVFPWRYRNPLFLFLCRDGFYERRVVW